MAVFWRMPIDADKHKIVTGKVHIIEYRCKGCGYCIAFCPRQVLAESKDFNEKGYHFPYVGVEGQCANCHYCETICPDLAIYCTEEEGKPLKDEDVLRNPKPRRWRSRSAR